MSRGTMSQLQDLLNTKPFDTPELNDAYAQGIRNSILIKNSGDIDNLGSSHRVFKKRLDKVERIVPYIAFIAAISLIFAGATNIPWMKLIALIA